MLALELLALGAAAPRPAEEAPRSYLWSPGTIIDPADYDRILTADCDWDADCRISGMLQATLVSPSVVHFSGHMKSLARLAAIRHICPAVPLVVTEGPQEAAQLLETYGLIRAEAEPALVRRSLLARLARLDRDLRNAIAHGRPADAAEMLVECLGLACERERAKLLKRFLRGHGGYVDPALNAEILAELIDDRRYAAPGRAVVQIGRRRASRTAAGHVMIPFVAVPVLAPGMTIDAALGQILRSGEPALPVGEGSGVSGVVTLADLARTVHDGRGVPSIQRIEMLMRAPAEVTIDTPLPEVRAAMSRDDAGLVVVRGPADGVAGYITASSLLGAAGPDEDDVSRGDSRMEVPLLGLGGGTVGVCVSS